MNAKKYRAFPAIPIENRTWPSKRITKAPIWCSVDLRDGNQALIDPMGIETKLAFFDLLVKLGFKEIEIGFPSASDTEYDFIRRIIDENRIPSDVTIQVLCQAREKLVSRTMECIKGAPSVIFHIYNSTSPAQRKYTFNKSKEEIIKIAVDGNEGHGVSCACGDAYSGVVGIIADHLYVFDLCIGVACEFKLKVVEAMGFYDRCEDVV